MGELFDPRGSHAACGVGLVCSRSAVVSPGLLRAGGRCLDYSTIAGHDVDGMGGRRRPHCGAPSNLPSAEISEGYVCVWVAAYRAFTRSADSMASSITCDSSNTSTCRSSISTRPSTIVVSTSLPLAQ